jgi:hypothetical protein
VKAFASTRVAEYHSLLFSGGQKPLSLFRLLPVQDEAS